MMLVTKCTPQNIHRWTLPKAARLLQQPSFPSLVQKFLYAQLYPDSEISLHDILEDSLPMISDKTHVFNSAIATFYASSNISGVTGMCCEYIQAATLWRKGPACYDCVLVNANPDIDGAHGFEIACMFLFFSFQHQDKEYPCALVHCFSSKGLDGDTVIGLKIEYPWIIHFSLILYSN